MENIHDGLVQVRQQLIAMQNLSKKKEALIAKKKNPPSLLPEPKQVKRKKVKPLTVFAVLLILVTVINLDDIYQNLRHQYRMDAYLDECAWNLDHKEDGAPYPGYEKEEPTFFSSISSTPIAMLQSLPVVVGIAAVYGAGYYVNARAQKREFEQSKNEIKTRNEAIKVEKKKIEADNEILENEIAKIHAQMQMISQEYQNNTLSWFPRDFGYLSAVDYFIRLADNHIASTIPEMVDRYVEEMRHKQLLKNQQEMINYQRIVRNNQEIMISNQEYILYQQMLGNFIHLMYL